MVHRVGHHRRSRRGEGEALEEVLEGARRHRRANGGGNCSQEDEDSCHDLVVLAWHWQATLLACAGSELELFALALGRLPWEYSYDLQD